MRTTIRIEEHILSEAKQYAHQNGQTLTSVIEEALRRMLADKKEIQNAPYTKLTTVGGGGVRPSVDLDDTSSLYDLMDGIE